MCVVCERGGLSPQTSARQMLHQRTDVPALVMRFVCSCCLNGQPRRPSSPNTVKTKKQRRVERYGGHGYARHLESRLRPGRDVPLHMCERKAVSDDTMVIVGVTTTRRHPGPGLGQLVEGWFSSRDVRESCVFSTVRILLGHQQDGYVFFCEDQIG